MVKNLIGLFSLPCLAMQFWQKLLSGFMIERLANFGKIIDEQSEG
jgi:hypothetical protein